MDVKSLKCETCLSSDRQLLCISKLKSIICEIQLPQVAASIDCIVTKWMSPLVAITTERFMLRRIVSENGGICWECHSIMMKFYKFRHQVQRAQQILSTSIEHQQILSLSSLSKKTKNNYDYNYIFIDDPLTHESESQVKVEPIMIKIEENLEFDDKINSDTDFDEKPLCKVFADSIKITTVAKERKRLHKKRSLKQDKKKRKNILNSNLKKETHMKKKMYLKKEQDLECSKIDKKLEESKVILEEKFEKVIFTEDEMLKCREEKMNQANYKKIPFKCSSCVTGFTKKENYELHLKKSHDESIGSYKCDVCQSRFASEAAETRHRARHYVQYRCRLCDYKVSSSSAAEAHARGKHASDVAGRIHCKLCPFLARTSQELSEHSKEVHSLICNECGVKFKGKNTLRSHKIRIHARSRVFACGACARTFASAARLEAHGVKHAAGAGAYCGLCRAHYKTVHVYRNHLRNNKNHVQERIQCPACDKKFASRVYFTKHYNFYHLRRSRHKCNECDKLFISEWRLKVHRQTHHGLARTRDHACNICDKKFYVSSSSAAEAHARGKHASDVAGRIHCKLCPFLARTSQELSEHSKEVHSLICNECGVKFKGKNTLRSHKIRIHARSRVFACGACARTFASAARLEAHGVKHAAGAGAYCGLCRAHYKTVHVYRNHLRNNKNHVQERIQCPACDKKFASRVYFTKHYNFYHLRRSRHKCNECDKLFISEWRLKVHRQTHHGLARTRDHACNICDKKFYTKATLLTHSLLHAPRAFMCATCGAAFRQRAALYTHMRLMHRDTH